MYQLQQVYILKHLLSSNKFILTSKRKKMKTKETSICRKCGGNGTPSKGLMNFHNIQTQDLSKEFETKLLDCIKCESCGHSWIPETSTKEQALAWWNSIKSKNKKQLLCQSYRFSAGLQGTSFHSLTGREIEEIWRNEVQIPELRNAEHNTKYLEKPNQKQFKQFDESLFKAYIDKFSDEDKEKCFEILMRNLDIQKAELINDGINLDLVFVKF